MRIRWTLSLIFLCLSAACSGGGGAATVADANVTDGSTPADVSAADVSAADAGATDATSADVTADATADVTADITAQTDKWWTCSTWDEVKGTKVPRSASCDSTFGDADLGCKRPWYGVTAAKQTFTCNNCLGGDPGMQGRWRAVDFKTEDPTVPLASGRKELLVIDGNTWHLRTGKKSKTGAWLEAKVDGWYWCADGTELKSKDNGYHITTVTGDAAMGWDAGEVFSGHYLSKGDSLRAWGFFASFNKSWIGYVNYCKIGSMVKGKLCSDPYK